MVLDICVGKYPVHILFSETVNPCLIILGFKLRYFDIGEGFIHSSKNLTITKHLYTCTQSLSGVSSLISPFPISISTLKIGHSNSVSCRPMRQLANGRMAL